MSHPVAPPGPMGQSGPWAGNQGQPGPMGQPPQGLGAPRPGAPGMPPQAPPPGGPWTGGATQHYGLGSPPPSASSSGTGALATVALLAGVVLTALGLSIPFDSSCLWATSLAWAIFGILAALVAAAPLLTTSTGRAPSTMWTVGAVGAGGLLLFWVLVALPGVTSNQGFVLTLATACALGGVWLSPAGGCDTSAELGGRWPGAARRGRTGRRAVARTGVGIRP